MRVSFISQPPPPLHLSVPRLFSNLFPVTSCSNLCSVASGPNQPVHEDGTPKQKRSESPTGKEEVSKKKERPWPWDVKLGGCQNDISNVNVARAEAKGCLVKHVPQIVKQHCTFKRKSINNPKQIICSRCKEELWIIIQEGHMEGLQQDYLRRMNERKAAPRQQNRNLSAEQSKTLMSGQVISTRAALEFQSERSHRSVNNNIHFKPIQNRK